MPSTAPHHCHCGDISFRWTALWIGAAAYSLVQNNAVERDGISVVCVYIYIYDRLRRVVNFKLRLISPLMSYTIRFKIFVRISSIFTHRPSALYAQYIRQLNAFPVLGCSAFSSPAVANCGFNEPPIGPVNATATRVVSQSYINYI